MEIIQVLKWKYLIMENEMIVLLNKILEFQTVINSLHNRLV